MWRAWESKPCLRREASTCRFVAAAGLHEKLSSSRGSSKSKRVKSKRTNLDSNTSCSHAGGPECGDRLRERCETPHSGGRGECGAARRQPSGDRCVLVADSPGNQSGVPGVPIPWWRRPPFRARKTSCVPAKTELDVRSGERGVFHWAAAVSCGSCELDAQWSRARRIVRLLDMRVCRGPTPPIV